MADGDPGLNPGMARVRVPKTSELIADQFRGQIVRGEISEGEFLPPEGQLMASLGISRPTLREAFRILEAEGLISVVRGSRTGARVHKPSVDLVSRYAGHVLQSMGTTIGDLYDARRAIEPHIVRRLATSVAPLTIRKLREEVERLQALLTNERYGDFILGTSSFHAALVEVSGSKTLAFMNTLLLKLITRHQVDHFRRLPQARADRRKGLEGALKSYSKLIDLIAAEDADGAVMHWQLHLRNAAASWADEGEAGRIVDSLGS